jgi:hypothetical protein
MLNHRIMTGLVGATLVATAAANVQESPYHIIVERNPFGLRPIPVIVEKAPERPPPPPLPEVKITGITTLLGAARVTLQYEDKEAKKVEFPPLLREGERYKNLVVERIDTDTQTVVIRNGDHRTTLDFVHNGVKPSAQPTMVAAAPPNVFAPVPPGGRFGSSNVIVSGNVPNTRPPLTPEQQRAQAEILLRKKMAEEQGRTGTPMPPAFPPNGSGLNPNRTAFPR